MNDLGNLEIPWLFILGYVVGAISEKIRVWSFNKRSK